MSCRRKCLTWTKEKNVIKAVLHGMYVLTLVCCRTFWRFFCLWILLFCRIFLLCLADHDFNVKVNSNFKNWFLFWIKLSFLLYWLCIRERSNAFLWFLYISILFSFSYMVFRFLFLMLQLPLASLPFPNPQSYFVFALKVIFLSSGHRFLGTRYDQFWLLFYF